MFSEAISFNLPDFDRQERKLNSGMAKSRQRVWRSVDSSVCAVLAECVRDGCSGCSADWCAFLVLNRVGAGSETYVFISVCVCVFLSVCFHFIMFRTVYYQHAGWILFSISLLH